jgi:hypothetical protein
MKLNILKKYIAVLLLFAFLGADTEMSQLLRFPIFVHHYLEHVDSDIISMNDFLTSHYNVNINHSDDKHHDHDHLPFRAKDCPVCTVFIALIKPAHSIISTPIIFEETISAKYKGILYSSTHISNIWQPPKIS